MSHLLRTPHPCGGQRLRSQRPGKRIWRSDRRCRHGRPSGRCHCCQHHPARHRHSLQGSLLRRHGCSALHRDDALRHPRCHRGCERRCQRCPAGCSDPGCLRRGPGCKAGRQTEVRCRKGPAEGRCPPGRAERIHRNRQFLHIHHHSIFYLQKEVNVLWKT